MNRQVNYIIYAMLLSLAMPAGYYFIHKITLAESTKEDQSVVIDSEKKSAAPIMSESVYHGKILFNAKCAACHNLYKDGTGPSLMGFEERGPWSARANVYEWIRNPAVFMQKDAYTRGLKEKFGSTMEAFPDITNEEIDAIVDFINYVTLADKYPVPTG